MKRFGVLILFFLNVSLLYTQENSRFPINPTAVWKMYYSGQYEEIFEYYIDNDTLLNSHKYYKLFKSGVAYYDTPFYYNGIYVGAIRDDDNKFFYVKKNELSEVQLFDFNLEPGDTIQTLIGKGYVVSIIDTLPDGRKRFGHGGICVFYCPVLQIVEGIGHAGGIMEDPPIGIVSIQIYNIQGIKLLSNRMDNQGDINRFSFDVSTLKKEFT